MKSTLWLFLVLMLSLSLGVNAQVIPGPEKKISPDLTAVEELPKFPGNVNKYLADNIHYPADAVAAKTEGKVYTKFIVTAAGEVTDVKVVKGVAPSLDAEAVRVLKSMPKWTPGKNKGKAIDVELSLPISFTLANAKQK